MSLLHVLADSIKTFGKDKLNLKHTKKQSNKNKCNFLKNLTTCMHREERREGRASPREGNPRTLVPSEMIRNHEKDYGFRKDHVPEKLIASRKPS